MRQFYICLKVLTRIFVDWNTQSKETGTRFSFHESGRGSHNWRYIELKFYEYLKPPSFA